MKGVQENSSPTKDEILSSGKILNVGVPMLLENLSVFTKPAQPLSRCSGGRKLQKKMSHAVTTAL
jgi:hypothetical protein